MGQESAIRRRGVVARLAARPLLRRMAGGLFWTMLGALCQRGGLILVGVVIGRTAGAVELGQFAFTLATATATSVVVGAAFGLAATRTIAESMASQPGRVGQVIGLLAVSTLVVALIPAGIFLAAPDWIAAHLLHDPAMASLVRVGAPLVLLLAANLLITGILAGFEAFSMLARVNALGGTLAVAGALGGFAAVGINGAVVGWETGVAIQFAAGIVVVRRTAAAHGVVLGLGGIAAERALLTNVGLPAAIGIMLVDPVTWFCSALLLKQPNGYGELGVFQAANQWFQALMFVPALMSQVNLPILTRLLADGDRRSYRRVLIGSIALNAAVAMTFLLLAFMVSGSLASLYGVDFAGRGEVFILCVATAALLGVQMPASNAVVSLGRQWTGAAMNAAWAVAFIICATLLAADGADGLALARLTAYGAHAIWTFAFMLNAMSGKALAWNKRTPA